MLLSSYLSVFTVWKVNKLLKRNSIYFVTFLIEMILFNGRFKLFLLCVISVTICGPRKQHHMGGLSPNTLSTSVLLAVRFKTDTFYR